MGKKYVLPDLPYKYSALEPTISEEIMRLHHDKHHAAYVNGANAALEKLAKGRTTALQGVDVKAILRDLAFNASGHVFHSLFWANMSPTGGGRPGGALSDQINTDFGSFDSFKLQLGNAAKTVEGSGWGCPRLRSVIRTAADTSNGETPEPNPARINSASRCGRLGTRVLPAIQERPRRFR